MDVRTRRRIDGLWSRRLGTPVPGIGRVSVGSSGAEASGVLVLRLGERTWVDAPVAALDPLVWYVRTAPEDALLSPRWWGELDGLDVRAVSGPAVHAWADAATPLPLGGGELLVPGSVAELPASWFADAAATFGVRRAERVVAASAVRRALGRPCEVTAWVAPAWRGRGLGRSVAATAVAWAVARSGLALCRSDADAPRALARSLGMAEYGVGLEATLGVSPRSPTAPPG